MRKLFQTWLFVVVAVAFVLAMSLSYKLQGNIAINSGKLMLAQKLNDAQILYDRRQHNLQVIREITSDSAMAKVRALELFILSNPAILKNKDTLEQLRLKLNVDEIHVSDEKGILIASSPCNYEGYDMNSDSQSRQFMPALTNKDFVLIQAPMANGFENKIVQYVGIARQDRPGIVQIGFTPQRLVEAEKLAELGQIESVVKIGNAGKLQITKMPHHMVRRNSPDKTYQSFISDTLSLCTARTVDDFRFVASIPLAEIYQQRRTVMIAMIFYNLLLFGIIYFVVSLLLQRVVIEGIYSVNKSLKKITNGDLDEKVSVHKTVEFDALSAGINATVQALKKSIKAEAKRIDAELEAGKTIQQAVLPIDFPNVEGNHVFAFMEAAREVGGDFYDIIKIDETHQALLIADVSGKGLTAALTMMTSKTLIKNLIAEGISPGQAMAQANRELYEHNPAKMFITVFLAVFNLETKQLVCVNAGHNPPLLKHGDQEWDYLKINHSVAIGVSPKARYTEVSLDLKNQDKFLLYTDGVTEAQNRQGELYGESNLKNYLNQLDTQPRTPQQLIDGIRQQLTKHANGEPQSDDITMLALFV